MSGFSVNTPNINNQLAIPYKKEAVLSSTEFLGKWSEMKDYVRRVNGHGGSYKANKVQRLSEEFPWPEEIPEEPGEDKIKPFKIWMNIINWAYWAM